MNCPIKLDKNHCQDCKFSKLEKGKPLCDYPYKNRLDYSEIREITLRYKKGCILRQLNLMIKMPFGGRRKEDE